MKEETNWKKMYDELYEIRIEDLKEQEKRFSKIIKEILVNSTELLGLFNSKELTSDDLREHIILIKEKSGFKDLK